MFNILGIDWGERKVGFALASEETKIILPKNVFYYKTEDELTNKILSILHSKPILKIIIGVPTNFRLQSTATSTKIHSFIADLRLNLNLTASLNNIEIIQIQERETTKQASNLQRQTLTKKTKSRQDEDSIAALILIKHYFNNNTN